MEARPIRRVDPEPAVTHGRFRTTLTLADSNIPDVFLCHNGTDKEWVRELGARLEPDDWPLLQGWK
jgi:hypothetical protein